MRSLEQVWEFPFGDALVLVRPELNNFYILNHTAASAWRLLLSEKPFQKAVEEFALTYRIPDSVAAHDLELAWAEWSRTILASVPCLQPHPTHFLPLDDSGSFSRVYCVHGRNIRVVLHHPDLIAEIAPRLEPLIASSPHSPEATIHASVSENGYQVFADTGRVWTEEDPARARVVLLQQLVRASQPGCYWTAILHGAACGTPGKCIIFPASSHSGKTTLAAALLHAGATFYSDDSVALQNASLSVPAMPFAMMIREGSWRQIAARFPLFENAPIYERYGENVRFLAPTSVANKPGTPTAIIFSQWMPDATFTLKELDAFDALIRLKDSGFWVAHDQNSIAIFLDWLRSLPIYEMIYCDLDEAIRQVKSFLV